MGDHVLLRSIMTARFTASSKIGATNMGELIFRPKKETYEFVTRHNALANSADLTEHSDASIRPGGMGAISGVKESDINRDVKESDRDLPTSISPDSDRKIRRIFQNWCKKYGKTYASAEEKERRLQIFKKTYEFVTRYNATRAETNSHRVGLNHFADYTEEESKAMHPPRSLRSVLMRPFVCSRPIRSVKPSDRLIEYLLNESLDMQDLLKGDLSKEYIRRDPQESDNGPELLKEYLLK